MIDKCSAVDKDLYHLCCLQNCWRSSENRNTNKICVGAIGRQFHIISHQVDMISVQILYILNLNNKLQVPVVKKTSFYHGFQDSTLEGDLDDIAGNTQFLEYLGLYM